MLVVVLVHAMGEGIRKRESVLCGVVVEEVSGEVGVRKREL
jgi:hypothetical protein